MRETPQERNQRALGRMVPGTIGGTLKNASPAQLPQSAAKPRIAQEPPHGLCNSFAYDSLIFDRYTDCSSPFTYVLTPVPLSFTRYEHGTASLDPYHPAPGGQLYVYPGALGLWNIEASIRVRSDGPTKIDAGLRHITVIDEVPTGIEYNLGYTHNELGVPESFEQNDMFLTRSLGVVVVTLEDFLYIELRVATGGTYFDVIGEQDGLINTQISGMQYCGQPTTFSFFSDPPPG